MESVKNSEVANLDEKLVESAVKTDELKALNNSSNDIAVNKTTTTVTVNVTQTKVIIDEVDKGQGLDEVLSTVSNIAEAAVGAIEKVEQESKKTETIEIADVEMIEPDTDCEMKDVSLVKKEPEVVTTTTTITDKKNDEAEIVNSTKTNATECVTDKIDDVEKNISNLFNGDDNVVSTNDKSNNDLSKIENTTPAASSQSNTNLLKNGTEASGSKKKSNDDAIKDNNDLVSILAGSDKPEERITSSSVTNEAKKSTTGTGGVVSKNESEAVAAKTIENKLLKGITSTPSNSTTQTNVYNSTPIQKQFEISSENVSTISEPATEAEHGLGGKATRREIVSSHSSTINEKSTLDISTGTG